MGNTPVTSIPASIPVRLLCAVNRLRESGTEHYVFKSSSSLSILLARSSV